MTMLIHSGENVDAPQAARFGDDNYEKCLEDLLIKSAKALNLCWIARQARINSRLRIDLMALTADGALEIWEIKRGEAPRDIIGQALEYRSWVRSLHREDIEILATSLYPEAKSLNEVLVSSFPGESFWNNRSRLTEKLRIVLVADQFSAELLKIVQDQVDLGNEIKCKQFSYYKLGDINYFHFQDLVGSTTESSQPTKGIIQRRPTTTVDLAAKIVKNKLTNEISQIFTNICASGDDKDGHRGHWTIWGGYWPTDNEEASFYFQFDYLAGYIELERVLFWPEAETEEGEEYLRKCQNLYRRLKSANVDISKPGLLESSEIQIEGTDTFYKIRPVNQNITPEYLAEIVLHTLQRLVENQCWRMN